MLNYEETHGVLPPSSTWDVAAGVNIQQGNNNRLGPSWVVLILPHLEQQAVYDAFRLPRYITDPANAAPRGTVLSVMLCPSDPNNRTPFNGSANSQTSQLGDGWARGNYAANASLGQMNHTFCVDYGNGVLNCAAYATSYGWKSDRLRGVMGANTAVRVPEIRDGMSNTILLGEIRAGLYAGDQRGTWAMSGGASALWGHGSYMGDTVGGPNTATLGCDNVTGCTTIAATIGWDTLVSERMTCYEIGWHNQGAARSMHQNGVHVCLCDGSVQWISDFINTVGNVTSNPPVFSVWDRLNLSADGAPANANAF